MYNINSWLQSTSPPNSYKIEIAYYNTGENIFEKTISTDLTVKYKELNWIDLEKRFINYSQANFYAFTNYKSILYRITGSNDPPNFFTFNS